MVLDLEVPQASAVQSRRERGYLGPLYALPDAVAGVGQRADPETAGAEKCAADDTGPDLPGQRWAVGAVSNAGKLTSGSHPAWCAPDRCGHLVPPLMAHMPRRHRGAMHRLGESRQSGQVVTYLVGSDARVPLVAVHVTSRGGIAWVELSPSQVAQLIGQLRSLLVQAGTRMEAIGD
ncbi:hypothetical protein AB0B94_18855 [Micromonospora sp. NPDC048986]|uniref:hypothetical protein n=1 Tax=Micromonospora sp. NPDC048986 TaxID=3155644 RepID=UPI0033C11741